MSLLIFPLFWKSHYNWELRSKSYNLFGFFSDTWASGWPEVSLELPAWPANYASFGRLDNHSQKYRWKSCKLLENDLSVTLGCPDRLLTYLSMNLSISKCICWRILLVTNSSHNTCLVTSTWVYIEKDGIEWYFLLWRLLYTKMTGGLLAVNLYLLEERTWLSSTLASKMFGGLKTKVVMEPPFCLLLYRLGFGGPASTLPFLYPLTFLIVEVELLLTCRDYFLRRD